MILTAAVATCLILLALLARWATFGLLDAHPGCCACGAFDLEPDGEQFANGTLHSPGGCR